MVDVVNKCKAYAELVRLDKPIGTLLLLWPTLTAVVLAYRGKPPAIVVFVFIVGVLLSRAAGCILNDIADRKLDRHVVRTQSRPITSGRVSVFEALVLCAILLLMAFLLVLLLNVATIIMACVAVVLAAIYPLMKRLTNLPQLWLGVAFNWGVLMAYTSTGLGVPFSGALFFLAIILQTVAYDTMYAMSDREDDVKIGVKSTAILFGSKDRVIVGFLQLAAIVLWVIAGLVANMSFWYYVGLLAAVLFGVYQQILIKDRDPEQCFQAFLNNNIGLMMIFIGVVLSFLA